MSSSLKSAIRPLPSSFTRRSVLFPIGPLFGRFLIVVGFGWMSPCLAWAEALDLADAVRLGLVNSPRIRGAEEKVSQARHEKWQLRAGLGPTFDLSASGSRKKDSVADMMVGSVPFGGERYNLYNVGLHGEQTLLTYGMFSGVGQADAQLAIGVQDLEVARRDLTRDVIAAYYRTLMNENLVRLLQEQERGVREILSIAQRRLALGGKRTDVLQVRTRLALLQPKIESARNELVKATAELASLIGRAEVGELRIHGHVPSLTVRDIESALDMKRFDIPELQKLRAQRDLLEDQRRVAMGQHLPKLKLVGDYNFINYSKAELFEDASASWAVKLVLSVPIFSGFSSIPERRSFVAQEAQLEASERQLVNQVQLAQIRSRKELESAEVSLKAAEEGARLARESLQEARREYRVGLINFIEFFQVESSSFEAETSLLQVRFNVISALGEYVAASGQSLSVLVDLLAKQGAKP